LRLLTLLAETLLRLLPQALLALLAVLSLLSLLTPLAAFRVAAITFLFALVLHVPASSVLVKKKMKGQPPGLATASG
jgi:hypothetical protein